MTHREFDTSINEVICPICGRPMTLLHTIGSAFGEDLNMFKCTPCGFSMTEPVSWTANRSAASRAVAKPTTVARGCPTINPRVPGVVARPIFCCGAGVTDIDRKSDEDDA
jgi:hypothetical protein